MLKMLELAIAATKYGPRNITESWFGSKCTNFQKTNPFKTVSHKAGNPKESTQ